MNITETKKGKGNRKLAFADFDFFDRDTSLDALEQLRELAECLPTAESAIIQLKELDTKDATRVRIKIIFAKGEADTQEITDEILDAVTWDN